MLDATQSEFSEIGDQLKAAISNAPDTDAFVPREPQSLEETGLSDIDTESLILKYLHSMGAATGKVIAEQIRLPFAVVSEQLQVLRSKNLVGYRSSAAMSDYEYELCDEGRDKARRYSKLCSFFGAAPVALEDYLQSVRMQSLRNTTLRIAELISAFDDMVLSPSLISQIGQAANAGRGLFLYGAPGNGKTCIAQRIMRAIRRDIWIPRAITITGDIIRLFDPSHHEESRPDEDAHSVFKSFDLRWVRIRRPSIVVGGELTLEHLEITLNPATGIAEAPIHLKSNGGALIVDDLGRQRVNTSDLLNRWSVPLEKGVDFLTLPSGRQIEVPFDQLLVMATNLDPNQIVDEAFLRRMPFKIEVHSPTEREFRALLVETARSMNFADNLEAIDYLIETHFVGSGREMRYCHAHDLLFQVKNLCEFQDRPLELTKKAFDLAVMNYFAGL